MATQFQIAKRIAKSLEEALEQVDVQMLEDIVMNAQNSETQLDNSFNEQNWVKVNSVIICCIALQVALTRLRTADEPVVEEFKGLKSTSLLF